MADPEITPTDVEDDVEAQVEVADKPREPTPYEKKLRTEAASYRRKVQEAQRARDEGIAQAKADGDARVLEVTTKARERLILSELKAHAVKAGLLDLDGLKLFDLTKVEMDDAGDISNAETLIESFKKAKPYLFNGQGNTSSPVKTPKPSPQTQKSAFDMSEEEYKLARKRIESGLSV